MLLEAIESTLITAVGDKVLWRGRRYSVAGRSPSGRMMTPSDACNPEVLDCEGPVLLCLDPDDRAFFIPESDVKILTTSPRYVIERVLSYLDGRGAVDWTILDDDRDETVASG